jgi:LmbE family N-acetylglucosaminyl deacetylase
LETLGDAFLGQQRLLVVAPHPDDETIGCAGTIARVKALGGQAYVMVVSVGGITQHGRGAGGQGPRFVSGLDRRAELDDVMKFLEVDAYEVLFDDDAFHERLDTVPQRVLIERIEYAAALSLETLRPSMVLLPARSFNQDHAATFRACMVATRPASAGARHLVPYVLAYDNTTAFWSVPDEWFVPNVFVDISEHLDTKVEAMRRYSSQLRPAPFHASPQGVQTAAAFSGGQVSIAAAEAFQALRLVW